MFDIPHDQLARAKQLQENSKDKKVWMMFDEKTGKMRPAKMGPVGNWEGTDDDGNPVTYRGIAIEWDDIKNDDVEM